MDGFAALAGTSCGLRTRATTKSLLVKKNWITGARWTITSAEQRTRCDAPFVRPHVTKVMFDAGMIDFNEPLSPPLETKA